MWERGSFLKKLLYLVDSIIVSATLALLVKLYSLEWSVFYSYLVLLSLFLSLLVFYSFQVYRSSRSNEILKETVLITKAWSVVSSSIVFVLFSLKASDIFSRVALFSWFIITPILLILVHSLVRHILRAIIPTGSELKNAIIVGYNELGINISKTIQQTPWLGIYMSGFLDDSEINHDENVTILGRIDDLHKYLSINRVDLVYIALPMREEEKILNILQTCRTMGCEIFLAPDFYMYKIFNTEIQQLGDNIILSFNPRLRAKRCFDIGFSLFAIALTLPVSLIVALLIKLQDGGPVFYGHSRITSAGRRFRCLKFRTMCVNAEEKLVAILNSDRLARDEWEKTFKLKDDPRVTRIGRFLRKTSLDELPQFINVLRGEMSVVGARPIVYKELCDYYKEDSGLYCSIKPGMTGPWQVSSRSDTEDYRERVRLDGWYALNSSLWLDLKIIFLTIVSILSGRGAY
jgi:exopolysaccharide biosynthesis polyprenyl glycosylphosphotransferase